MLLTLKIVLRLPDGEVAGTAPIGTIGPWPVTSLPGVMSWATVGLIEEVGWATWERSRPFTEAMLDAIGWGIESGWTFIGAVEPL